MFVVAYALVNVLDLLTTYIAGVQNEANPIVKRILEQYGFPGFALGKVLVIVYFVIIVYLFKWIRFPKVVVDFYQRLSICLIVVIVAWNVRYLILR
ncbi:hypothetical protein KKE60_04145 [Patescibacteria group bacterium]|nr:hypothetical protein [Patescibacteria group bacterium]